MKVYGGEFAIQLRTSTYTGANSALNKYQNKLTFYRSGRECLAELINEIRPQRIWLPSLICASLWQRVQQVPSIRFFEIENDLGTSLEVVCANAQFGDMVLLTPILGQMISMPVLDNLQATPASIVIDLTHCILDAKQVIGYSKRADHMFASLRKTFAIPDGGFIWSKCGKFSDPEPHLFSDQFTLHRLAGLLARGLELDQSYDDGSNLMLLQEAERILDSENLDIRGMSPISLSLLAQVNVSLMSRDTRSNYTRLKIALRTSPNLRVIPESSGITPYLAVLCSQPNKRDKLRESLRRKKVFCPVHWPTNFLPKPHDLSANMLSVACDSRYSSEDIDAIAKIIRHEALC
jgi:hypothetical protein